MNIGRISTPVLLSFLIIMFITVIGCDKKPATSVISGTVSGDLKKGITINLTGAVTASTTTDLNGNYSFTNQENGNYTVTPYFDGYTFSPTSTNVAVSGASVTGINFTSTHSGYGISGTVTGDVAANVTLTLSDLNLTTTTTDSDGKYTLRSTDIGNSTYIVKPYLAGYKFNPYTQSVPMNNKSVTGIDFVSHAAYTAGSATGTYTWNPTTGYLTITWTPETVPCNWPQAGTDAEPSVTITNTTMTWPNTITWPDGIAWLGMLIWTRTSATANDPAGVWTAYDQSGNKYTATFTATDATSGSISLVENIVACAYTWSEVIPSGDYHVSLSYQDPLPKKAHSVSVTGPGISGSQILTYNTAGEWNINGTIPGGFIDIPSFLQTPPYTYTFTVLISDPDNKWDEISCFVDWPTDLHYGWVALTKTLTFYWTGVASASGYVVQVKDTSYNLMWESPETSGNSINYGITPAAVLTSGNTYYFYVQVRGTSYCANGTSYTEASFIAP
ncbi:MAG: hypothetical protein ABSE54_05690 [Smithella sp.]|jgi:hypothetical protein